MHSKNSNRKLKLSGTRLRIFLLVFASSAVAIILFSYYLFRSWGQTIRGEFDVELYNIAVDIRDDIERGQAPETTSLRRKILPFDPDDAGFQFTDFVAGRIVRWPLAFSKEGSIIPTTDEWSRFTKGSAVFHSWERQFKNGPTRPFRIAEIGVDVPGDGIRKITGVLQIAAPYEKVENAVTVLRNQILIGSGGVLILILIGSLILARLSLRPLESLILDASRLKPGNLQARIPIPKSDEGLQLLAKTLNQLLGDLENATESQERFIREASHQLKTPIAVMAAESELISKSKDSSPDAIKFAQSVNTQIRYLGRLVQGLLVLARVDRGEGAFLRTKVSIPELLFDLLRSMEHIGREKGVSFRLDSSEGESFEMEGDEALLRSLFETLLDNAIQYAPSGTSIRISLEKDPENTSFFIANIEDQGPGIPEAMKEKVFERFFKGSGKSKGFGLGLSIARGIALAHSSQVILKDNEPHGLRVILRLKKNSS